MKLPQGSPVARAMRGTAQENAAAEVTATRVMDERDFDREARGTARYEELRLLKKEELLQLVPPGHEWATKQTLIALIIDGELHSVKQPDKMGESTTTEEER